MKKLLFISIIFLSGLIFFAGSSFASNISFETEPTVNTGENLDVVVKADTEGVLINGIEFIIDYDQNLLSFTGYSDDNAVVKLWINPPEEKEGKIYLSGIVPGGVLGLYDANKKGESRSNELSPIPLVHLFFTAKNTGKANFSFVDSINLFIKSSKVEKHTGIIFLSLSLMCAKFQSFIEFIVL